MPLVVIVGPTASGKTALSLELAEEFHGEIVSADSRQIYRGLDIGTAKVMPEEQGRVPHHLIDVAKPTETLTLAQYQKKAFRAIEHIQDRGLLPFLVGGTGLYVQAVVDNLKIPKVAPQPKLRAELDKLSTDQLADRLKAVDPLGHSEIDKQNPRRLVRAIEVSETQGTPFSELKDSGDPRFDALMLGVQVEPGQLKRQIRERLDEWLQRGLLDEIRSLHDEEKVPWERLEAFGLHYCAFAEHLEGKRSFDEAKQEALQKLLQYAKRQITWFKRDRRIHWIEDEDQAEELVSEWLVKRAGDRR